MPADRPVLTTRYCDLVMKGGITSGIVYPPLVAELAKHYCFKNIGGTSAGAIAAAAAAAAEFRRRNGGPNAEFPSRLGELPGQLAEPVGRQSRLFSLFQPERGGCRRLFRVLVTALNVSGTWRRVAQVFLGFLVGYWLATLASVAGAVVLGLYVGIGVGLLGLPILLVVTTGIWVYADFTRGLVANGYGMCSGMTALGYKTEALTPWLHELIQDLAGKPLAEPLTFEDLWHAPGFPPTGISIPKGIDVRSIDLRMFTTNLSTGRPFVLPLTNETCRLFFQPDELARFIPKDVMDHIRSSSVPYAPASESDPPYNMMEEAGLDLWELPAGKWPVVLAARISLGFPLLFSAVPLWAINYDPPPQRRTFKRCLFSDGGISSNFPVHMFDGLLPLWPTFGVQLEPALQDRRGPVYLPESYFKGYGERWNRFDDGSNPGRRMGGFLIGIVSAMQNWIDNTNARMPGVRDRVVRVRLGPNEGGLNLKMPDTVMQGLARKGTEAAKELLTQFADQSPGWRNQRWVRLRVALHTLHSRFRELRVVLSTSDADGGSYTDLIDTATKHTMGGEHSPLGDDERDWMREVLASIQDLADTLSWLDGGRTGFKVIPETDLKVRPST